MQLAPLLCARLPPRPWDRPQRNSVLHLLPPSLRRAAGPLSVPDLPVGPPRQSSCVACLPLHRRQSSARKLGAWSVPAAHSLQQTEEISPQASATARVDGHDRSNISQANGRAIPSAAAYPPLQNMVSELVLSLVLHQWAVFSNVVSELRHIVTEHVCDLATPIQHCDGACLLCSLVLSQSLDTLLLSMFTI